MNVPYVFKKCSECGKWLVASTYNFHKDKQCEYGLKSKCKKCRAEQHKQYHKQNREKILEQKKEHYKNNRDKILECREQYYENNRDKIAEYKRKYYENNKDKIKHYRKQNREKILERKKQWRENNKDNISEYGKQYRATPRGQALIFNKHCKRRLREQNQGNGITPGQWLEMMKYFNWECAYSGEYIGGSNKQNIRSIDHIIPLNKDGVHEIWNVVPMDRRLNSSKNNKDLLEWYQKQPFFSEERLQKIYEWQQYAFNKWHKDEII